VTIVMTLPPSATCFPAASRTPASTPSCMAQVRPGYSPAAQERPSQALRVLTRAAAAQGRLVVDADQASAHILVTNIGVTLRQIILATPDPLLSAAVREGAIAAITGTTDGSPSPFSRRSEIHRVLEHAAAHPDVLGAAETQLLTEWLTTLATP